MVNNLGMKLIDVKSNNREDLLNTLRQLADTDCDFNGENGIEYNWEITDEKGYESNLDYVIDVVKQIDNDEKCIETFFEMWLDNDSYYHEYSVNYLKNDNGNITAIAFAVIYGS